MAPTYSWEILSEDELRDKVKTLKRNLLGLCGTKSEIAKTPLLDEIVKVGIAYTNPEASGFVPNGAPGSARTRSYAYTNNHCLEITYDGIQEGSVQYTVRARKKR